jgi:2-polyprenyl-3-methyl-5-hydroxy-6-metoxy-1,4-benzoquinol methylase
MVLNFRDEFPLQNELALDFKAYFTLFSTPQASLLCYNTGGGKLMDIGPRREPDESPVASFYESAQQGADRDRDGSGEPGGLETNDGPRLEYFLTQYREHRERMGRPLRVLDLGCGVDARFATHVVEPDEYWGLDITEPRVHLQHFVQVDLNSPDIFNAVGGQLFDLIFCGEVIEHVFSPDALLEGIKSVMHSRSLVVLSTPNLAYWVNRFLLPLGISPLFVENSARHKLGRRTRLLGQGNRTEGHIRVFTHRAMLELLAEQGFCVRQIKSMPLWNFGLDRFVCRVSPHLAPNNIYVLTLA